MLALDENTGGAGGFAAGVTRALEDGPDWVWMLDDDTIPEPGALEALLDAPARVDGLPAPALLCSRVKWTDGAPHPMNEPWPRWTDEATALGAIERGLLAIRAATYVSILVSGAALQESGPPRAPYFIWGDDVEFTARVLKERTGYYVPESVVVHKTKTNYMAARSDSPRYALDVRNKLWMVRAGDVWQDYERLWWISLGLKGIGQYLQFNRYRPKAWATIARGVRDGLARAAQPDRVEPDASYSRARRRARCRRPDVPGCENSRACGTRQLRRVDAPLRRRRNACRRRAAEREQPAAVEVLEDAAFAGDDAGRGTPAGEQERDCRAARTVRVGRRHPHRGRFAHERARPSGSVERRAAPDPRPRSARPRRVRRS